MKQLHRIILSEALLILLTGFVSFGQSVPDTVSIDMTRPAAQINDFFWGSNFLFWVEDDASLADGSIEKTLKDMPCTVLRFPGGTVADNYHWKTNLLHNSNMFPYEEGEQQSDFDEFMEFCLKVGAEPLLVVNTQSWALEGDIDGGAREAAEWVRYCKDKGYKVKYWEIGNETYWHPVMTAKEYGHLANVYAKAMKAADPDITLSVNGGWDTRMTGNKERTDPELWEGLRSGYLNVESIDEYRRLKAKADSAAVKPWTTGEDKWWHDLITTCGDNIDMVSVHWYFFDNNVKNIDRMILKLKSYLKELKPHKDYLVCLSEYNCNTPEPHLRMTGLAESVGRFLNSGIDMACFWPLRIGGRKTPENNRSMLSSDGNERQYPWQIYSLFQGTLKGSMIGCVHPEDLYTFASYDGRQLTAVLSGRSLKTEREVIINLPREVRRWAINARTYEVPEEGMMLKNHETDIKREGNTIRLTVPDRAFTMITLKRR